MRFVLGVAREFKHADWRRWLSEMSCSEFRAWADYFSHHLFSADLLDYEFASVKLNQYLLAGGAENVTLRDFCLFAKGEEESEEPEEMDDEQIMAAATFIAGGVRVGE